MSLDKKIIEEGKIDKANNQALENAFKNHKKVKVFLEKIANQIHTQDEAEDIKEELYSHIKDSIEEYLGIGYSFETAINKALLDMGDPSEIGYSFTNYELMKKRKFLMYFFKIFGTSLFLLNIFALDYREFIANGEGPEFTYMIFIFSLIYLSVKNTMALSAMPLRRIKIDLNPLLIVWPVKKRLEFEYKFLMMVFSPIPLIFIFMAFYESSQTSSVIYTLFYLILFIMSILMVIHSEKYRIPKYILLEEGILIKNKFTSWTAIDRIEWRTLKQKKNDVYELRFKDVKNLDVTSKLISGEKQRDLLNKMIREKIYA